MSEQVVGKCPHYGCGGSVIEEVTASTFDPRFGPQIIGPGGMKQMIESKSYHCDKCSTVFTGPPKKIESDASEKIGFLARLRKEV